MESGLSSQVNLVILDGAHDFRSALNIGPGRNLQAVRLVRIARHHQVRASIQGKPKRVGRRSNWNKIGKHGHGYESMPELSTRGVVDIT